MEKVQSRDGTLIAYERSGEGPPLVIIPGVLTSARRWPVLPALGRHFTVYAVDRRGHGDSGDTEPYRLEREFEDVAAVADAIGTEVNVLGHSFGGRCVLGAALLTPNIRRLVVYETHPPEGEAGQSLPAGLLDRFQVLVDAGNREEAVITFLREVLEMPADQAEAAKRWPTFPAMVAAAHTFPREVRADAAYQFEVEQFAELDVPTLLLVGGDSPNFAKASMARWHSVLRNSRLVTLPSQQHLAHYTAPDLLVHEIATFLSEPD